MKERLTDRWRVDTTQAVQPTLGGQRALLELVGADLISPLLSAYLKSHLYLGGVCVRENNALCDALVTHRARWYREDFCMFSDTHVRHRAEYGMLGLKRILSPLLRESLCGCMPSL